MLTARQVTINLDKHSRVPTVQVNFCELIPQITLMLDTGSGPNIIKEHFVPSDKIINYNNILKLSGINEYPVYTLGEVVLPLFEKEITFHIVSNDFPISQSGILGNDFFKQTFSKIDYAKGYLDVAGINVPFFSPEIITAAPRSESLFYVRVGNPDIKIGYIPKLKIAHGIYSKETIAENIDGKAYFNVISTLDEEVEVQVPTLCLKPLNDMLDDYKPEVEMQNESRKIIDEDVKLINDKIDISDKCLKNETREYKENQLKNEAKFKENNEHKELNENFNLNPENPDFQNFGGKISLELPRGPQIHDNGSNLTRLGLSSDPKIHIERNIQIPPEFIRRANFETPPPNHLISADPGEQSFQNSSCDAVSITKEPKEKSSILSEEINFPVNKKTVKNGDISCPIAKTSAKESRIENLKINDLYFSKENEPSSEHVASIQQTIEKFKNKIPVKEKQDSQIKIPRKCLKISENSEQNRLAEITELLRLEHLNTQERDSVMKLIFDSQDRFHIPGERLTATHVLRHQIPTTDDRPINIRQYRFPQIHKEEINRQVGELLEGGIVKSSQSPYNTPIWIVPKKEDSKGNKRWRMVLDFRALNEKTIGDAYPLPNIVDIIDQLGGAGYFSIFDLAFGFHQIEMDPVDSHKTAFTTPFGHYEFERMPFGLKNAPATFQRLMDLVLSGLQGKELFVYMDDIVIYASSLQEHERKYNLLMDRLREANLKLQPDKCEFLKTEVTYLGHIISKDGIKPDPKKLEAVRQFPRPKTPKNIKQFLGLTGYYRRFIPNFSTLTKPLTNLLKNDVHFEWTSAQQNSFEALKEKLCEEPVLQYPDFSKPFILTTDASSIAVGGILSQGEINKDRPIAYASRTLTDNEIKYDTYEKEALAIVYCVKHFRPYLYGRKFTLVTDHKPLLWFKNAQDANMRILRWRLKLAEYDYDVVYKAGKANVNADALSRNPVDYNETICNIIRHNKILNPDNPRDAEIIAEMLEETDEEDEDFDLYLSDEDELENPLPVNDLHSEYADPTPLTPQETEEPQGSSRMKEKLTHDLSTRDGIQTRSQTAKIRDGGRKHLTDESRASRIRNRSVASEADDIDNKIIENQNEETKDEDEEEENDETINKNDPPDKEYDSENNAEAETAEEINEIKERKRAKPTVIKNQIVKSNVLDSRELLFLRKDNLAYFVDTTGKPLDSGSQKLFERNALPNLGDLILGKVKAIKYKKRYHMVLPVSEGQREGPTMTLAQITAALKDLCITAENLKLETLSIAKTDIVNNVPWNNIKPLLQLTFINSTTKVIICNGLVKYPPRDLRPIIIGETHCLPTGGHRGVTKTYNRIKHNYYWENLKTDVQQYIQQCLQCQLKKLVRVKTKQPMAITDTPGTSFDKVAMDIVGPLPKTMRGNEYILTLQDQLTKFCMGIPLPDQTSETIAEAFVDKFICVLGAPKAILTDQGRNFISELMKKIAKLFRIRKFRTTAFHPQSNGSLERSHHALGEYLKQYANEQKQWDRWIGLAIFNYNTNVHEATKHTPYELVFGKIARIPSNELLGPEDKLATYDDYLINLITQLHGIQTNARENVINAKVKSKEHYDKKINPQVFRPGDYVFLLKGPKPGKFSEHYSGPHEVLEILNRNNVKIRIKKNSRIVHPNRLRISYIKPDANK